MAFNRDSPIPKLPLRLPPLLSRKRETHQDISGVFQCFESCIQVTPRPAQLLPSASAPLASASSLGLLLLRSAFPPELSAYHQSPDPKPLNPTSPQLLSRFSQFRTAGLCPSCRIPVCNAAALPASKRLRLCLDSTKTPVASLVLIPLPTCRPCSLGRPFSSLPEPPSELFLSKARNHEL